MQQDLLNDALVSLRHADLQGTQVVTLAPVSKLVGEVLRILQANRYIDGFTFVATGRGGSYEVKLSRRINSCGVIKPRLAVRARDLEKFESRYLPAQDFGRLVLSTSQGVITQVEAREQKLGGRLLAYVY
ncbi:MAG: 30S ribosomal protein S8 [Thermoplasmata archaeon]|nr:30S ribosomal protein S8 [Thermoplasmata archaeon]